MSSEEPKKDAEADPVKEAPPVEEDPPEKGGMFDAVFGEGYNVIEVRFTICAAILVALNNGFVNGVCLSGLLSEFDENQNIDLNPKKAMVSGVAAYVTNSAEFIISNNWDAYRYNLFMLLSYMGGALITAILSPRAKAYAVDPMFGPSFLIGGTMLLCSSVLSANGAPPRWIYYLAIAANGVQNGVASIYSANLIRCTLTGAITDIGLVIGQVIRGNYDKVPKGLVLALIVICFWLGGLISYHAVRALEAHTLFVNAGIFYTVGFLNIFYLVHELHLSFFVAVTGDWNWKYVLNKIKPSGSKQELLDLFEKLDHDESGTLDMYELQKGLRGKVSDEELKTLLQAADSDGSGDIDKQEWIDLVEELFRGEDNSYAAMPVEDE